MGAAMELKGGGEERLTCVASSYRDGRGTEVPRDVRVCATLGSPWRPTMPFPSPESLLNTHEFGYM
jgi:hypothetical protein